MKKVYREPKAETISFAVEEDILENDMTPDSISGIEDDGGL